MSYTAITHSVFMMRMDEKVMPTDDNKYNSHIKP